VRDNSECHFGADDGDLILQLLRNRIAAVTELFVPGLEATAVLHYTPGQRFLPHYDYLDEAHPGHAKEIAEGGQRVLTFLLSLNDDYEGGETQFPILGKRYRGKKGNALFFWNATRFRPTSACCGRIAADAWREWILSRGSAAGFDERDPISRNRMRALDS
jgi:hypothetical protein